MTDTKISVIMMLGEFAIDIAFYKEVDSLLSALAIGSENKFSYDLDSSNRKEFPILIASNTSYLENNFIQQFELLIKNKDEDTQLCLERAIQFKYKLESSNAGFRNGNWQNFRSYIGR